MNQLLWLLDSAVPSLKWYLTKQAFQRTQQSLGLESLTCCCSAEQPLLGSIGAFLPEDGQSHSLLLYLCRLALSFSPYKAGAQENMKTVPFSFWLFNFSVGSNFSASPSWVLGIHLSPFTSQVVIFQCHIPNLGEADLLLLTTHQQNFP